MDIQQILDNVKGIAAQQKEKEISRLYPELSVVQGAFNVAAAATNDFADVRTGLTEDQSKEIESLRAAESSSFTELQGETALTPDETHALGETENEEENTESEGLTEDEPERVAVYNADYVGEENIPEGATKVEEDSDKEVYQVTVPQEQFNQALQQLQGEDKFDNLVLPPAFDELGSVVEDIEASEATFKETWETWDREIAIRGPEVVSKYKAALAANAADAAAKAAAAPQKKVEAAKH